MAILALGRESAFLISQALLICIVFAYPKNETIDIQALLEFKFKITNDPLKVLESWNVSTPICQWYGVTCSSRHKRVEALYLNSSKITGTISPYVGNLSFLRELVLENNNFIGNIPSEIGHLQRLRSLGLRNNSLIGTIPSNISNCYNLKRMDFWGNQLDGDIPVEIGYFPNLVFLSLRKNYLSGHIPPSIGNLSALEMLDLGENKITGTLPYTLGRLHRLALFSVPMNRLSGSIPSSLYNLSSLSMLIVEDNMIHGSLPPDLFNTLPNLQYFLIWKNQITGNIPISLSNASNLVKFETAVNNFIGNFPSLEKLLKLKRFVVFQNHHGSGGTGDLNFICSLTNNTNLEVLDIGINNLGGILPKCIGNLSSVIRLEMDNNNISGPIPMEIGTASNLEAFMIYSNQLTGEIPSSIGNLVKLVKLYLQFNKLSGNIPSSLGNLKQLTWLALWENKLQGEIPRTLGECKSLNKLYLDANDLVGSIPLEIFRISSLVAVNVSQNRLDGPLPELVENLENLDWLDVSENMLSHTIPSSLVKCVSLRQLYMQGNHFEGMIPPSLGSLRGIEVIDLSRNDLFGQIPRSLANLMFLENLNLSYNNLEGPMLGDGIFKNTSKFSITGNKKLCGGIPELALPKCNIGISHKKVSHIVVKVIISVFIGFLGMFLIYLWISCWLRKKRNTISENYSSDPLLRLSYQSLLKATSGFSSTNKLGSGSFGSVYKANLETSQTIVAVKVFDLQKHGVLKTFLAECEVLKSIKHRNLVKILTACSSIDFSGNEFKALVYEFMANGSLEDWLHSFPAREDTSHTQKHLGLMQRLNIAIDVACALDYLHYQCEIPIIHRDIKPSNVLLNDEMIGHIGDFGLSKILSDASSNNTTKQMSSTAFNGTIGYIAPEYGMCTSMSTQGDVYSYGVLLLEMFTGKRPNDVIFHGDININCFVKTALPDKVREIVDPRLYAEIEELANARKPVVEYLIAIFQIGVSCSANLPRERKSMRDVVGELKSIKKKFLANLSH